MKLEIKLTAVAFFRCKCGDVHGMFQNEHGRLPLDEALKRDNKRGVFKVQIFNEEKGIGRRQGMEEVKALSPENLRMMEDMTKNFLDENGEPVPFIYGKHPYEQ